MPKIFFFFQKIANGNFFEKNENFWQFFWKKCQAFGNFLTVKWQFSGGSGPHTGSRQENAELLSQAGMGGRGSRSPEISPPDLDAAAPTLNEYTRMMLVE